ncbi:hypothetical protein SAMN04488543_0759 [Friedmanniella luteola]|uniref:Integral membrane protein n=1 Tax=Friedmanniella luteola TaxID=546871 RepID=A0A1H1N052_9ACTN|nr:hypothetical protein [Friedmanniella luteola]SDR92501.1 hypothetical protein SAMN04488543_0759 [Friedmanniella luteola]
MTEPPRRPPPRPPYGDPATRADVRAAWEARKELGPEYDEHIANGLAERVEELVAYRTAELRHSGSTADVDRELERTAQRQGFVLGIISLGTGIPVTAIAVSESGLPALVVAWLGIVGVNLAQRIGRRRS